jgi:hypothetical protein
MGAKTKQTISCVVPRHVLKLYRTEDHAHINKGNLAKHTSVVQGAAYKFVKKHLQNKRLGELLQACCELEDFVVNSSSMSNPVYRCTTED